jgi:hypothetical protein
MERLLSALLVGAACAVCDSAASADEPSDQCLGAYNMYLKAADRGDLVQARQLLRGCANETCALVLQRECVQASAKMDERIPTAVTLAHGNDGNDISEVEVSIDGQPAQARIDGREIPLNPGPHTFRFRGPSGEVIQRHVVVVEREKGRIVEVTFGTTRERVARGPEEDGPSRPMPPLFWVLGGVGVASLATFAGFGLAGATAYSDLNTCAPSCSAGDVTTVKQRFFVADLSLVVAIAALGGAAYVLLSRPSARPRTAASPARTY